MWIVRVALDRPYIFIVLAVLILVLSPVTRPSFLRLVRPQSGTIELPNGNTRRLNLICRMQLN